MKKSAQNPHDKFFRASMQYPKLAVELLQAHIMSIDEQHRSFEN